MNTSRRALLKRAILTLTASTHAHAQQHPTAKDRAAMADVATAFMKAHSIPGLSVAVSQKGELVHEQSFGFADRDNGEKVTPSSLFRIASVSKPITSATIFKLMEEGRLALNDLVFGPGGILRGDFGSPPYKQHVGEIRIRHLLTHTAGGWQNDGSDPMFQHPAMDHQQLITWAIANLPLAHPPGEHYAYSNFGYCILGRIIEKVTGQPYAKHVHDAILSRCGISGMRIAGNTLAARAPGEVVYYRAGDENPYDMNVRRMDSHGGWLSNAADLMRFAAHVDGFSDSRDILKPASIHEMTTATTANPQYAKGWAVNSAHNWWHSGSLPGTTSIMVRTASGFCWAALANSREAGADTGGALDRMMWDMVHQVPNWHA